MKLSYAFNAIGLGDPMKMLAGMLLISFGLLTIGNGQIGIWFASDVEVKWIDAFAKLDNWLGWVFIWLGLDSFFDNKATMFLLSKVVSPIFNPIFESIFGQNYLIKFRRKQNTNSLTVLQSRGLIDTIDGVNYRPTLKLMQLIQSNLENDNDALIEEAGYYDNEPDSSIRNKKAK